MLNVLYRGTQPIINQQESRHVDLTRFVELVHLA